MRSQSGVSEHVGATISFRLPDSVIPLPNHIPLPASFLNESKSYVTTHSASVLSSRSQINSAITYRDFDLCSPQDYFVYEARLRQRINEQAKELGYDNAVSVLLDELERGFEYEPISRLAVDRSNNFLGLLPLLVDSDAALFADTPARVLVEIIGLQRASNVLENAKVIGIRQIYQQAPPVLVQPLPRLISHQHTDTPESPPETPSIILQSNSSASAAKSPPESPSWNSSFPSTSFSPVRQEAETIQYYNPSQHPFSLEMVTTGQSDGIEGERSEGYSFDKVVGNLYPRAPENFVSQTSLEIEAK